MASHGNNGTLAEVRQVSAQLIEAGGELLRWEWDTRFSAVLAVVRAPNNEQVLSLVSGPLSNGWDHRTIGQSPEPMREIAAAWGGVMPGQRLFALDPDQDPMLFAAWWPWSDGATFSLRIGYVARSPEAQQLDPEGLLRDWFSIG